MLTYTYTLLGRPYVVHEVRFPEDPPGDQSALPRLAAELPGRDIAQQDGVWPLIYEDKIVTVSAAPIHHSVPCVGYVVQEKPIPGQMDPKKYVPELKRTKSPMSLMSRLQQGESITLSDGTVLHGPERRPGRKITILGDTYDPSPIAELAMDSSVLIHEATNAYLPGVDETTKETETYKTVEARAKSRGHSTPEMAGQFAARIRAKQLMLNHFSARYPGNDDEDEKAESVMSAIRKCANEKYDGPVLCARDLLSVDVFLDKSGN
jgi:ribonuclease Z